MPYVLKHTGTDQIFTCTLTNHYGLAYYGVKFWMELEEAEAQYAAFLQTHSTPEADQWQILALEEGEMKLCNVKLKNDPFMQVFWSHTRKPDVRKVVN